MINKINVTKFNLNSKNIKSVFVVKYSKKYLKPFNLSDIWHDCHTFILIKFQNKYYFLTFDYQNIYEFNTKSEYEKFIYKKYNYYTLYDDKNYGKTYEEFINSRFKI